MAILVGVGSVALGLFGGVVGGSGCDTVSLGMGLASVSLGAGVFSFGF